MALRRVLSKTEPKFESMASDEEIARWPDMWDVLEGEPNVSALLEASAAAMQGDAPRAAVNVSASTPPPVEQPARSRPDDSDFR